eukprot:scaffold15719_cov63-Phaeocystis_antarctica.AAC.1
MALLPPCAGGRAVAEAAGSICSENCSGSVVGASSGVVASPMRDGSSGGSGISCAGGTYASEVSGALIVPIELGELIVRGEPMASSPTRTRRVEERPPPRAARSPPSFRPLKKPGASSAMSRACGGAAGGQVSGWVGSGAVAARRRRGGAWATADRGLRIEGALAKSG